MRSYHSHVSHLLSGPKRAIKQKPCFRSSALFPAIHREDTKTRLTFMGYWFLKRQIREVSMLATLRTTQGEILHRHTQLIRDSRSYRVEVEHMLEEAGIETHESFLGSIELEFFSAVDMFFPYAAAVVNYYGPKFSSVVHTAQRIYNNFEDMHQNSEQLVPESGFNIYADEDREPFFYLVNGCEAISECPLIMEFYNHKQEVMKREVSLGKLHPYEMREVYPLREVPELKDFLGGVVGAAKIHFQLNWVYPRLIAGNLQHSTGASVTTHTYYDCSDAASADDYWKDIQEGWHPATLNIPVNVEDERFTNAYFYPLLSPSTLDIDVEVFDEQGNQLGRRDQILKITSPCEEAQQICFKDLCKELSIDPKSASSARIIAHPATGSRLPSRIKLGLDLGKTPTALPCNICTNLWPFEPKLENKPQCFRWAPVLADQEEAVVCFLNGAPLINYERSATIHLLFHREQDNRMIERTLELAPHGSHTLRLSQDKTLKEFFQNTPGWFTATSSNPYITTYYFAEHTSGVVGGDHGF